MVNDRLEAALPATCAGILERILVAEGAAAELGAPAAIINTSTLANVADLTIVARPSVRSSPVARRIANSANIDITRIQGTGVSGRITKADVFAALPSQTPPTEARSVAASPIAHPPSPIPYVLTAIDVDLERVARALAQHGPSFARRRLELSYRVCIALAVVAALPAYPLLNSYWANSAIVARRRVYLAVVACDGAPVRFVCDAQDLNLRGLARAIGGALAEPYSQIRTFTIAELGDHVWGDPAVLAAGSTAALGIGTVRARARVLEQNGPEQIAIRHTALLILGYDPRVLDQCYADAFLRHVKSWLEQFHV